MFWHQHDQKSPAMRHLPHKYVYDWSSLHGNSLQNPCTFHCAMHASFPSSVVNRVIWHNIYIYITHPIVGIQHCHIIAVSSMPSENTKTRDINDAHPISFDLMSLAKCSQSALNQFCIARCSCVNPESTRPPPANTFTETC